MFCHFFIKFTIPKPLCDISSCIRPYFLLYLGMHNCTTGMHNLGLYRNTYTAHIHIQDVIILFGGNMSSFFFLEIPYHLNAYLEVSSYKNNLTSSKTLYRAAVLVYMPTDPSAFLSNHFKHLHIPRDQWSSRKGAVSHMELLHSLALCKISLSYLYFFNICL